MNKLFQIFPSSNDLKGRRPKNLNPLPQNEEDGRSLGRFPSWLHHNLEKTHNLLKTRESVRKGTLRTVCEESRCPNLVECYQHKTATFLTMGHVCTRACGFCSIEHSKTPPDLDPTEGDQIAQAALEIGLKHIVLTQVARDDLEDGGSSHLVTIMKTLREKVNECTLEVLTSDFEGNLTSLKRVLDAGPEVFNHNIETVRRLSPRVRHKATYERTLLMLKKANELRSDQTRFIKSGLMVGLGESDEEVYETLQDLQKVGVEIVTIGQYLQATKSGLLVKRFVPPETFATYQKIGKELGIKHVYSAPFVRSSYNAHLFV